MSQAGGGAVDVGRGGRWVTSELSMRRRVAGAHLIIMRKPEPMYWMRAGLACAILLLRGGTVRAERPGAPPPTAARPGAAPASPKAPPGGRVLPFALGSLDEDRLLGPGGRAVLYALGDEPTAYAPHRPALVLIHGLSGRPADLQAVVDRFRGGPYQIYILVQDDWRRRVSQSGADLAEELGGLGRARPGRSLTIVAHSMGGLVARLALNLLAVDPRAPLGSFSDVHLHALDTPWHGYRGPSDRGADRVRMAFARPFLPPGMWDLRARSALFEGDPASANQAMRVGLLNVPLPAHVSVHLSFAESGDEVLDHDEGDLRPLARQLVAYYRDEAPVRGEAPLRNFWRALLSSRAYYPFQDAMRRLADAGRLDEAAARRLLHAHFPRLPGDHHGVLSEKPGRYSLLDHLQQQLAPRG